MIITGNLLTTMR